MTNNRTVNDNPVSHNSSVKFVLDSGKSHNLLSTSHLMSIEGSIHFKSTTLASVLLYTLHYNYTCHIFIDVNIKHIIVPASNDPRIVFSSGNVAAFVRSQREREKQNKQSHNFKDTKTKQ